MAANMTVGDSRLWRGVRWVVWGGAAGLLLLPLVAMQFTREVQWTLTDFIAMGAMLGFMGGAYELAVRAARSDVYVVAFGVGAGTAFLMTWVNLAVGIIGTENNPANQVFFGVLLVGLIAVAISRLRSRGMARAMEITALAQAATSVVAVRAGESEIVVLIGCLAALWVISAQLFRKAARQEAGARATPKR